MQPEEELNKMSRKIKVLMVDDEAQFRETTERILTRSEFHTILSDILRSLYLSHSRMDFEEPAFGLVTADQN